MKYLYKVLVLLIFLESEQVMGQIGVQANLFLPVKEMAYILKPGGGGEICAKSGKANSFFKIGGAIGFSTFQPTQDTFPVYAIQDGTNGNVFLPGYIAIKSYQLYSLGLTTEFKIFKEKKFSPIAGVDGYWYIVSFSENYHTETLEEASTQNESSWVLAVAPKVGISYNCKEKWLFSATLSRSMGIGPGGVQSYWKPSVGLTYYFE